MNAPTKPKRSHEQVMAAAAEVVFDHWIEHGEGMTPDGDPLALLREAERRMEGQR